MKKLKHILADIKNSYYHKNMKCIVFAQAKNKSGSVWILKPNGESLTVQEEDLQGTTKAFKLAKYVGERLEIFDASNLSAISLEKLTEDFLNKEEDVDLALEFAEMVGIDLLETV